MGIVVQAHVGAVSRLEAAVAWESHPVQDVVVVEAEEEEDMMEVEVQGAEGEGEGEDVVEAGTETLLISQARL